MIHFSLLPDKNDWNATHYFLDSKDLNDCCDYPDYRFLPWLYHVNIFNTQVYIKKARKNFILVVHNFNSAKIKLQPSSGYLKATFTEFRTAYSHFVIIVKEIIAFFQIDGGHDYGLPF